MDEQDKQLLSDFNEALKTQMIEMRQKAITLFDSTMASGIHASFDLKAKCFLGYEYSRLHPVQTMRAKKMWAVMNNSLNEYMPLYWDGAWSFDIEYRDGKGMSLLKTRCSILMRNWIIGMMNWIGR